jgi:hypothetical protein
LEKLLAVPAAFEASKYIEEVGKLTDVIASEPNELPPLYTALALEAVRVATKKPREELLAGVPAVASFNT